MDLRKRSFLKTKEVERPMNKSALYVRRSKVLSYGERERIKKAIDADRKRLIGETEGIPNRFQRHIDVAVKEDPRILRRNIEKLERVLSEGSPDSLTKHERNKREKLIEQDKVWLQSRMVPKKYFNIGWRDIKDGRATKNEYDQAVQGLVKENSPGFQRRADRLKNNLREIDPDNPSSSNLEDIRPG
jgi:hypothetical protein